MFYWFFSLSLCDMAGSEFLRKNLNQHTQKNKESFNQDVEIKQVVANVHHTLNDEYPDLQVYWKETISLRELESIVSDKTLTSNITYIKPDGGFLYIKLNGKDKYILSSEQKRQGTNDSRLLEGLSKQSQGNAAERLGKNVKGLDVLFCNEDIYPFVVFLQGCDFFDGESTIGDRIRTIAQFQEMNTINLYWKKIGKHLSTGGSYFMRGHSMYETPGTSNWTFDEMFLVMYSIAKQSIEHYLLESKKED